MRHNINSEISLTYIVSNKKLTFIAALGVTIGIAMYIFMNSMTAGFSRKSNDLIFKTTAHIRVYKDDVMSLPLISSPDTNRIIVITNPKVVPESQRIVNPSLIVAMLRKQPDVTIVTPQVAVSVFYNSGKSQITGNASGVIIDEADKMFSIASTIVEGKMEDLKTTPNGILLGVGIAKKMSVETGSNISITSSKNVTKIMKVVACSRPEIPGQTKQNHTSILRRLSSYYQKDRVM